MKIYKTLNIKPGNFLYRFDKIGCVTNVTIREINQKDISAAAIGLKKYMGISITDNILNKIINSDSFKNLHCEINQNCNYYFEEIQTPEINGLNLIWKEENKEDIAIGVIEYVHDLQNLLYNLTNKKLILNIK